MTRKQLLLVACAILAVLGGVIWVLLSENLVGIIVLGVSAVILVVVAGSWVRLHLMGALFRPAVKRDDLEDDHYRALKAQYANTTSPFDQEIAFRQARELVRKRARAMRDASTGADAR